MARKWCNWMIGENVTNWCVPGDYRGEFILRLYRMGIYTTKNQGMIKTNQSRENQIIEKIPEASGGQSGMLAK